MLRRIAIRFYLEQYRIIIDFQTLPLKETVLFITIESKLYYQGHYNKPAFSSMWVRFNRIYIVPHGPNNFVTMKNAKGDLRV